MLSPLRSKNLVQPGLTELTALEGVGDGRAPDVAPGRESIDVEEDGFVGSAGLSLATG